MRLGCGLWRRNERLGKREEIFYWESNVGPTLKCLYLEQNFETPKC
jgi:hypothetical protein